MEEQCGITFDEKCETIPKTGEAVYYRLIFEKLFPNCGHVIPHYWMPNWCNKEIVDPSARVLDVYDDNSNYCQNNCISDSM